MSSLTLPARKLLSSMEIAFIDYGTVQFPIETIQSYLGGGTYIGYFSRQYDINELLDEGFLEFIYVPDGEDYYRFTEDHMNSLLREQTVT
jgi:hypothetical protein